MNLPHCDAFRVSQLQIPASTLSASTAAQIVKPETPHGHDGEHNRTTATTTTPGGEPGRKHGGSRRNSIGHEVHKADLFAVRHHARPHRSLRVPYLDGGAAISPLVVRPDLQMLQVQYGGGRERLGARDNRKGSWRATQDTVIARSSAALAVEIKKSHLSRRFLRQVPLPLVPTRQPRPQTRQPRRFVEMLLITLTLTLASPPPSSPPPPPPGGQGLREGQRAKDPGDEPALHGGVRTRLPPEGGRAVVLPEPDELVRTRGREGVQVPPQGKRGREEKGGKREKTNATYCNAVVGRL